MPKLRSLLQTIFLTAVTAGSAAAQLDSSLYADLHWRVIGPFRAGRTVAVSGVPQQPNVFYMAPNNGGVWKTTDAGRTWLPIFDGQPTGSIGALAVAPSDPNVLYVGSGEGLQRPDLSVGNGIYKSTDAGATWTHLGLREARQIASILIDPKDPSRVFVAALGHPYGANEERGVFRSTDGGATWQRVLYVDENTGASDLAFDPTNAQTIYAVLWSGRQAPWEYGNAYTGTTSGLYKSTDGGTTWHPIGDLPKGEEHLGRIGITIAPSDPSRMYALVEKPRGGLYRSDDAGEHWTRVNTEERVYGRGDDFAWVRVDPRNKDVVWVANTSTYRSTNGGTDFTAIKGAPGGDDYHSIWINPNDPDIMLLGVDQGATITVNGGATWSSWYNQPTAQMFHVITDNRFPYWVYGAQQESGSMAVESRGDQYGEITFRETHPVGVEEYGYVAPDPLHPGIIYGGKVSRYDERTGEVQQVGPVIVRTSKHRFDRTAPVLFSPIDPHILYFALDVMWKTTNGGITWTQISPDLTRDRPSVPSTLGHLADGDTVNHRGVIYAIGPSPRDVNTIWAGSDDGLVHVTRDGGAHWRDVTPDGLTAWSKVTQIDAGHFDVNTAYVSVSRFRLDDLHPYVYRTRDGGRSWTTIVRGLPENATVDAVREDPVRRGLLFAATEIGVFVSFDDGDHWQSLQLNLPVTSVRDLVIHDDDIVIGTHGRSFWILDDLTPLRQLDARVASTSAHLFAPALATRVRRNENTDTPLPPEEPAGRNPPDGAILDYWLGTTPSAPIVLEILDPRGVVVRRFSDADSLAMPNPKDIDKPMYWIRMPRALPATPGMHRWVWDLRLAPPEALEHDYPISAILHDTPRTPEGVLVPPGGYTVRLTVDGHAMTQPLRVRMDPRVPLGPTVLAQQYALARALADAMTRDTRAVQRVQRLRAQIAAVKSRATGEAAQRLTALDSALASVDQGHGADDQGLTRLDGTLSQLLEVVDGVDAAPTTATVTATREYQQVLSRRLAQLDRIVATMVPPANAALQAAGLEPIRTP